MIKFFKKENMIAKFKRSRYENNLPVSLSAVWEKNGAR